LQSITLSGYEVGDIDILIRAHVPIMSDPSGDIPERWRTGGL
jgi:hypothetical protein